MELMRGAHSVTPFILIRQPLPEDLQAWYDAATGILYIDVEVPPPPHPTYQAIMSEVVHELLGHHHLAPHVWRPAPALRLVDDADSA